VDTRFDIYVGFRALLQSARCRSLR